MPPAPAPERLTAADAERRQRRFAAALAGAGLRAGDRVAVVAPPSADHLCLTLGALRTGVVPVLCNPALLPAELDPLLADAEPALVLRGDDLAAFAARAAEPGARAAELADAPLARPMHYTSGTTGVPKAVWSGLLDEADAAALLAEEVELWAIDAGDVHVQCSPLHHSAPVRFAAATLAAGGDVVLPGAFDAERFLQVVAAMGAEGRHVNAFCVPAHLQRVRALGHGTDALRAALAPVRLLAHAGAPCPVPLKRWAIDVLPGDRTWEFYGSTEGQFTACPASAWLERPTTVGPARPGRRLRVDEHGVVWCEVPRHARFSYWRAPGKTAAAWDGDAFTVGDLGRLDADGYLFLDGRRDDLIISGGVNVYPVEVEHALAALDGVEAVAVFGRDDERWGQRVCAAVVGAVDPDDLLARARTVLAAYKCPKEVVVVDEIPHTPTGKVRRSTLAADLGLA